MRVLKIPLRCMPTTCLTIPIVLRTAQIAKSRLSFSQLFPFSLIIILKVLQGSQKSLGDDRFVDRDH